MNEIKNADMPAMPCIYEVKNDNREDPLLSGVYNPPATRKFTGGLTKRETVLMEFMKAMLSNPEMDYGYKDGAKALAEDAMGYANAYFKELEK